MADGCELLILNMEPGTDDAFAWRMGHVIDVKPAGWGWGDCECLPNFVILQVSDMDIETGQQYLGALLDADNTMIGIRKWIFNFPPVPAAPIHGGGKVQLDSVQQMASNLSSNGVSTIAMADLEPLMTQVAVDG